MKKLFVFGSLISITFTSFGQTNTAANDTFAYTRQGLPGFTVYKAPDSTAFSNTDVKKKRPILLMLFSPECGHCQHVASEILKNMDSFKKAQILMITWLPYRDLAKFYSDYKLAKYSQITPGWDGKFFFVPYYHVSTFPKLIAYNKNGKFVGAFEGNIKIEDVWKALDKK